jgi:16S rRNA (guanine1516-N2)-methyltransferase
LNSAARLAVEASGGAHSRAASIARRLDLPLLPDGGGGAGDRDYDALVLVADNSVAIRRTGSGTHGPVSVDFGSAAMRHRRGAGHNELLGRAVGVGRKPGLQVIDATAGLGRDSFVLADLGCHVLMCEREPVVAVLLESGLAQGLASGDPWLQTVLARLRLWQGDAMALPAAEIEASDVIYLDPMFPPRSKRAAVKKEMALFQLLLAGRDDDAEALLAWCLEQEFARVVVKRPLKALELAGSRPSHAIRGKTVRYDVYVRHALG